MGSGCYSCLQESDTVNEYNFNSNRIRSATRILFDCNAIILSAYVAAVKVVRDTCEKGLPFCGSPFVVFIVFG